MLRLVLRGVREASSTHMPQPAATHPPTCVVPGAAVSTACLIPGAAAAAGVVIILVALPSSSTATVAVLATVKAAAGLTVPAPLLLLLSYRADRRGPQEQLRQVGSLSTRHTTPATSSNQHVVEDHTRVFSNPWQTD